MTFEKVLAERKDKVIYKDGDTTIKVFDTIILSQIFLTRLLITQELRKQVFLFLQLRQFRLLMVSGLSQLSM